MPFIIMLPIFIVQKVRSLFCNKFAHKVLPYSFNNVKVTFIASVKLLQGQARNFKATLIVENRNFF